MKANFETKYAELLQSEFERGTTCVKTIEEVISPYGDGTFRGLGIIVASGEAACSDGVIREVSSVGKGATRGARLISAILEVCERIAVLTARTMKTASFLELGNDCLDPREMVLDSSRQRYKSYIPFSSEKQVNWFMATNCLNGTMRWIHRPIRFGMPGFFEHTTNGVACAPTKHIAIHSGLLEVIERDALLVHWYCQLPAAAVLIPETAIAKECLEWLSRLEFDIRCLDISTDIGVPVVIAICSTRKKVLKLPVGAVVAGCAADVIRSKAIEKAMLEVVQAIECLLLVKGDSRNLPGINEHLTHYLKRESISYFDFFNPNNKIRSKLGWNKKHSNRNSTLVKHVEALGYESWSINRHIQFGDLSLSVAETGIPGLQPLSLGIHSSLKRLDSKRLLAVRQAIGIAGYNANPHPLG